MSQNSKTSICCILNYPSHYRYEIYQLMEDQLHCNFFFGTIDEGKIKKIDYPLFRTDVKELKTKRFLAFNRISGAFYLIFKPYKKYILTGDILCISNWLILIFAKLLDKKVYLWTHGWYGDESKIKTIIKKIFFKLSSGIFLYGDYAKKLMVDIGFRVDKLHVLYNSLDYTEQLRVRNSLQKTSVYIDHFKNNDPVLIFTGRLIKEKKMEQLIEAHNLLLQRNYFFNVVMVGDGPELSNLEKLVKNSGTEKYFWFYGSCYDESIIGELYNNAFLCVTPGNIGLTAIHSMMFGCPVITHGDFFRHGPEFELIEKGKTGDFFEYDQVNRLSESIQLWATKHPTKDKSLISSCYQTVDDRYNPQYQIKVMMSILL